MNNSARPESSQSSNLLTDTHVWQRYFSRKGAIYRATGEALRCLFTDTVRMLENRSADKLNIFPPEKLNKVTNVFLALDKKITDEALYNANLFFGIKTKLVGSDDSHKADMVLLNLTQILKDHDEDFYKKFVKPELKEGLNVQHLENTGLLKYILPQDAYKEVCSADKEVEDDHSVAQEVYTANIEVRICNADKKENSAYKDVHKSRIEIQNNDQDIYDKDPISDNKRENRETLQALDNHSNEFNFKEQCPTKIIKHMRETSKQEPCEQCLCSETKITSSMLFPTIDRTKENEPALYFHMAGENYIVTKTYKKASKEQLSANRLGILKMVMPPDYRGFALMEKLFSDGKRKRGFFPVDHLARTG